MPCLALFHKGVSPRLRRATTYGRHSHPLNRSRLRGPVKEPAKTVDLFLLPLIVLIGAMFLMTRSAKNKQRAAMQMRDNMQPGTGVRTIGGMYATVKEISGDTVVLEIAPGVPATFAKNAIGAVLDDAEFDRIVHGIDPEGLKVTDDDEEADVVQGAEGVDLSKADASDGESDADEPERGEHQSEDGTGSK